MTSQNRIGSDLLSDAIGIFKDLLEFTKKQWNAWKAIHFYRFVLYGGARGGGKSFFLRWAAVAWLIYVSKRWDVQRPVAALFCETYPELRDRQISKIKVEFPAWLGELKSTQDQGLGFYLSERFGGGVLLLRNLDKPEKYQSAEFIAIFVDELTKTTLNTFNVLRGSLRWPGVEHTIFVAATNPGGIGHEWVKRYWIDGDFPPEMQKLKRMFKFIQSLPSDNPHLEQVYWDDLNALPEDLAEAWVRGNWDIFQGMAFPGFDRNAMVIEPFEIPEHWPIWRAVDWGYHAPFACLWAAKDPDIGRIYIIREAYGKLLTDKQQAEVILQMTPWVERSRLNITYADPAMWAKKNVDDVVTSAADQYAKYGVQLTKADNARIQGKRKVVQQMTNLPDGEPGLMIFNTCKNLVRTLPSLALDDVNVEDVDTDQEDHAYDALRYLFSNIEIHRGLDVDGQHNYQQQAPLEQARGLL